MKNYQSFITFIVFFTAGFYLLDQKVSIPFLSASVISLIIFGMFLLWDKLLWKQKQFTKSMLQYFQKWEPWYKWIWIALFRPVGIFLAWISEKI